MPFILLAVFNFMIMYKATRFSRSNSSLSAIDAKIAKRRNEMVKTVIIITFLYIAVQLPSNIVTGYFYDTIKTLEVGGVINALCNNIQFSYPAFNVGILFISNKLFAKEVKRIFKF